MPQDNNQQDPIPNPYKYPSVWSLLGLLADSEGDMRNAHHPIVKGPLRTIIPQTFEMPEKSLLSHNYQDELLHIVNNLQDHFEILNWLGSHNKRRPQIKASLNESPWGEKNWQVKARANKPDVIKNIATNDVLRTNAEIAKNSALESAYGQLPDMTLPINRLQAPNADQSALDKISDTKRWADNASAVRSLLDIRKELFALMHPHLQDEILHQPQTPVKPKQKVSWEESHTKNLDTDKYVADQLLPKILQLMGPVAPEDFIDYRAGMLDPSYAGNSQARSNINAQNLAVAKERMLARGENVPWQGRILAPEHNPNEWSNDQTGGVLIDPRQFGSQGNYNPRYIPGFGPENGVLTKEQERKMRKTDPVLKAIDKQQKNRITQARSEHKRMSSPAEQARMRKRAEQEAVFIEDDIDAQKRGRKGLSKWFGGAGGAAILGVDNRLRNK